MDEIHAHFLARFFSFFQNLWSNIIGNDNCNTLLSGMGLDSLFVLIAASIFLMFVSLSVHSARKSGSSEKMSFLANPLRSHVANGTSHNRYMVHIRSFAIHVHVFQFFFEISWLQLIMEKNY